MLHNGQAILNEVIKLRNMLSFWETSQIINVVLTMMKYTIVALIGHSKKYITRLGRGLANKMTKSDIG